MKKISFLLLLIFLLIFTSACSNTTSDNSSELETEGMTIDQKLNFGDGLFEVNVEDADVQGTDLTLNLQVVNNSDKEELVSDVMNFAITQNDVDLNGGTNGFSETNSQAMGYTINPNATADLTLQFTLQDNTNPINIIIKPGDETGFNIPGQSQLNITINPADSTVDCNEVTIEG